MSITIQQFLELLRSGLWNKPADTSLFKGQVEWDAIVKYASQQTVLGIVAQGIVTLPAELQPSDSLSNKIRGRVIMNMRSHTLLNNVLAEVVGSLTENGFSPVLLKGQGVALNYVEPTLRQCGDIDLYIGREDYLMACLFVCERFGTDEHAVESEKHYHFTYKGVVVEIHRIAERLPLPIYNRRFKAWSEAHLHGNQLRTAQFGETKVALPPLEFDVLYVFNHAWHHFMFGGIGLRQLCDWVRILHNSHQKIDLAVLEKKLKAFGLWHAWRVFGHLAVDSLGLPQDEFPFYTTRYSERGSTVLDTIMREGNFGKIDPHRANRPSGYLSGKLHSLMWQQRRFFFLLPFFTFEIIPAWTKVLYSGIKQVLRDVLPAS